MFFRGHQFYALQQNISFSNIFSGKVRRGLRRLRRYDRRLRVHLHAWAVPLHGGVGRQRVVPALGGAGVLRGELRGAEFFKIFVKIRFCNTFSRFQYYDYMFENCKKSCGLCVEWACSAGENKIESFQLPTFLVLEKYDTIKCFCLSFVSLFEIKLNWFGLRNDMRIFFR